jgi:hypothetical protein
MKRIKGIFTQKSKTNLKNIDDLYNHTISLLSTEIRQQYCENLIWRLKDDLKNTKSISEIKILQHHLKAAEKEIILLNN